MLRIWLNRTYATHAHTIGLLRANPESEPVHVTATHVDPSSPVMLVADETEPEPSGPAGSELSDEAYVAWALDLCARRSIDIFWPRQRLAAIAAARRAFDDAGVGLVASPAEAASLLDDKAAAYRDAEAAGLAVPPWRVVSTGAELREAYELLRPLGDVVCKPVRGVGADGYRVLTDRPLTLEELVGPLPPRAHLDEAAAALDQSPGTVELLVMPYLPGPEVSVDCLADDEGDLLAAVPRSKVKPYRAIVDDPEAVEVARRIVKRHRLGSLSNTQVRYWQQPGSDDGPRPYLLETNARVAGGIFQTILSGLNLPWAAVRLAQGRPVSLPEPALGATYATVSSLVQVPH